MIRGSLRDLAKALEKLCADHEWYSVAQPVVSNCCDHLCAIARIHEQNALDNARVNELERKPLDHGVTL